MIDVAGASEIQHKKGQGQLKLAKERCLLELEFTGWFKTHPYLASETKQMGK